MGAVPVAVCAPGAAGDALARQLQQLADAHLPDQRLIVFNRACTRRDQLLARLADGLHSRDWRGISNSANALRVGINRLRDEGFIIDSIPDEGTGLANPSVTYLLRSVPQ